MGSEGKIRHQEQVLAETMKKAQAGDEEAYRELLTALSGMLRLYARRVLWRMGKGEASLEDDLVQDILVAVHTKRHTYNPEQPFLPWVFSIARYKLIDFGRKEKRRGRSIPIEDVEQALASPVFAETSTAGDLRILIASLPEKSRRLLEMVKIEGLSIAEAAAHSQMSESAVKVSIHRAIKALKVRLRKEAA